MIGNSSQKPLSDSKSPIFILHQEDNNDFLATSSKEQIMSFFSIALDEKMTKNKVVYVKLSITNLNNSANCARGKAPEIAKPDASELRKQKIKADSKKLKMNRDELEQTKNKSKKKNVKSSTLVEENQKNITKNEQKHAKSLNEKNCFLNHKKNCFLNHNSCFIDLSNVVPNFGTKNLGSTPNKAENEKRSIQTEKIITLQDDLFFILSETKEYANVLKRIATLNKIQFVLSENSLKITSENQQNIDGFCDMFFCFAHKQKIYKLRKNAEELPGILDFFKNESLVGTKLYYKKYSDQKNRPKVCIYICSDKTKNLNEAQRILEKLKNFYFYKEIMISHMQKVPFDLKNEKEFQEAQKQGYLTNELIKQLIESKELVIDPRISYKFIEKTTIRQRLFPFSVLFYWQKNEKLSEMRSLIHGMKEKIKKFVFSSVSFKTDISMSSANGVIDSMRSCKDLVISHPIIYNSKLTLSFICREGKIQEFIKHMTQSLQKACSELNILSITFKCKPDEEYQNDEINKLDFPGIFDQTVKRFDFFGSGNFVTYYFSQ